jgi:uncharacterized membrane protein YdjX (TVP38/TMEM64 family)
VLFALLLVLLAVLGRQLGLGERLAGAREWLSGLGPLAPLVFIALYVAATVAALPGSALSVAAGAIFGPWLGVITVLTGATIGAAAAFLIARYAAREPVARWLARSERFARLDQLTERHGAIIVAVTRLVPLFPFNLLNYGFGLTRVPFGIYVFWSAVCMLPGTILYVGGAAAISQALTEGALPWGMIGLVAAVGIGLAVLGRVLHRRIGETTTTEPPAHTARPEEPPERNDPGPGDGDPKEVSP